MSAPHILVVDDEPDIRNLVREILEDEEYQVAVAEDGASARQALRERRPDLVLLDIWMPDIDGISLLKEWAEDDGLVCPVIMMSGHGTVETAVEATRLGAYDFLEKPLSLAKLLLTVERGLEADQLKRENVGLRRHAPPVQEPTGKSPVMQRLREQVKRIAQHDTWVLITGESGSGRETLARYLHSQSVRKDRPFVDLGVTSIARGNAAYELFGSEEGGSVHYGWLEQAAGGTLFLDEVADMDLEVQTQLLGALDTGTFMRVGGSDPVKIDVRIIAATQRNLEEEVKQGRFREDLFYHLNVVPLHVPPLREHPEDVPDLLNFYVDWFVAHDKLPYRRFNVGAQNFLRNHSWHGNVRELKNLVQRLLILGAGDEITQDEVETAMGAAEIHSSEGMEAVMAFELPLRQAREKFEKAYLEYHLRESGGNISRMAKQVGMERTHLYRKLRGLEIELKERR
ncbi:sigma-54-dependent transcriptional regulator [Candidatus Endoriftia persephone]|jgi:DNA-binding NtrC family response regulator|uniref:Nitrogen assimilation regulatory protein NtrX n=3 Tax=Gammaproteobacteria TaxID=1236 RepID=G2FE38_9GAMM|nr:sigma-54 dependent transcriptional regulator [Candidatus Endoriftia persephone]EGV50735.1 nitrogen assimilation regulatory protein ntrX [endosymbiont of Riftia pachyptila (vent Ph05)]EGW55022.1 nitrogen assimilation regulatory protein NtrX [endosymbiont of Tevnia jerichonana (vent Tica)]USF87826.1 sigma-54 dependent transcriptional regulator [Candidatus Endoriftia persephone]